MTRSLPPLLALALLAGLTACDKGSTTSTTPATATADVRTTPVPASTPPVTTTSPAQLASAGTSTATATSDDEELEIEPEGGLYTDTPEPTSAAAATQPGTFTPQEIREYCGLVARNARFLWDAKLQLAYTPRFESLDELVAKLQEAYQFNTDLDLTDDQRKALADTLWVNRAFIDNAPSLRRAIESNRPFGTVAAFATASERWCQQGMRGNQPPFVYEGDTVPYVEIKRS